MWAARLYKTFPNMHTDGHQTIGQLRQFVKPNGATVIVNNEFNNLRCNPEFLDMFSVRSSIKRMICENASFLHGVVLDVGCGNMPYKQFILSAPSNAAQYIGLDLERAHYGVRPDLVWDGLRIPLQNESIDCVLATEVFEHCPQPEVVMREIHRVLKAGGTLYFTVPFLWPLHEVPFDEYRYTPFALERHLRNSNFDEIKLKALGGWDASLAQMIGLWVRRRSFSPIKRRLLSFIATPIVRFLLRHDDRFINFNEGTMITGIEGTAHKACV